MGLAQVLIDALAKIGIFGGLTLVIAAIVTGCIWGLAVLAWRKGFEDLGAAAFVLMFALALVGGIVGFATGLSRVGVVGNIVPSILALFGGLSAYLFGVDRSKGLLASLCVVAFSVSFFAQITISSRLRDSAEARQSLRVACLSLSETDDKWRRLNCDGVVKDLKSLADVPFAPSTR